MKKITFLLILQLTGFLFSYGQNSRPDEQQRKAIISLIDLYSQAREKSDTVLLKKILTAGIDQLVSTGEWRDGVDAAVQGMLKSSAGNAGTRTLQVEKIKLFNKHCAIADCRYEIQGSDGGTRKMWSSFIVVGGKKGWKISAIRNMLPSGQ